jgi:hypothetical protein
MAGDGHTFEETPERLEVIAAFDEAQRHLEIAGNKLRDMGLKDRAHKALNIAQQTSAQKCLLSQDWALEDKKRAA